MNSLSLLIYLVFPIMLYFIPCFVIYYNDVNCKEIVLDNKGFLFLVLVISIFFSFFFGFRYDVGVDYLHYYKIYQNINDDIESYNTFEPAFKILYQLGLVIGAPTQFLFIFTCFVQIWFYLYAFIDYKDCLPFAIITLCVVYLFTYMNIIRQCAAYSILLCGYTKISKEKYKTGLFFILFAALFHKSSLIGLLVFCVLKKRKYLIDNYQVQLCICVITILIGPKVSKLVLDYILSIINTGAIGYLIKRTIDTQMSLGSGLGVLVKDLTYIILIYLLKDYEDYSITIIKRIFFIGMIFVNLFTLSIIVSRIGWCFMIGYLFLISFISKEFKTHWKNKNDINRILFLGLWFLLLLSFFASLFGNSNQHCVPFQFNMGD